MASTSRVRLVLILLVTGLIAGNVVSRFRPVLYQSTTVLQVMPPKLPGALHFDTIRTGSDDLYERLHRIKLVVQSRTNLESIAKALDIGKASQQPVVSASLLSQLRERTSIRIDAAGGAFLVTVSALDPNPKTAQDTAEKLAAVFVDKAVSDQTASNQFARHFYERQADRAGAELAMLSDHLSERRDANSLSRRIELEALQKSYKDLLAQRENARMMSDLLQEQGGEQLTAVEPAMLPEHPAGPSRLLFTMTGGLTGLLIAMLAILLSELRRFARNRRPLAPATIAD